MYTSVARIGQAHTRQAIQTCAKERPLSPQMMGGLLQLVTQGQAVSEGGVAAPPEQAGTDGAVPLAAILDVLANLNTALDRDPNIEEAADFQSEAAGLLARRHILREDQSFGE